MSVRKATAGFVVLAVVVGACSAGPTTDSGGEINSGEVDVALPPDIDLEHHSVPLQDIYFDTFDGGAVPLSESTEELRSRLLDAIPPIDEPVYGPASAGDWLAGDDLVLGYLSTGQAYAYPFKILNFHEIVNDVIDGVPVLISYCPLCRSAIVFDRRVDGQVLSFGNTSALYESDLVMVDRQTGSYWWQVAGRAIVGPLDGETLDVLAASVSTWAEWKATHPNTLILTRDTGFNRPYEVDSFANYSDSVSAGRFAFPVNEDLLDGRLDPAALVVGIELNDVVRAYPIESLGLVTNDVVASEPIVLFSSGGGAAVFAATFDGEQLQLTASDGEIVDTETGSVWGPDGIATSGALAGGSLRPIPARTTFWFAFAGAFPEAEVYVDG